MHRSVFHLSKVAIFLVNYVGERPWWAIKVSTKEKRRKPRADRRERDKIQFIIDSKEDKL